MKNRENVLRELDKIDSLTNQLNLIIKRQEPIQTYMETLGKMRECVDQARLYVNSEPINGYELNVAAR
jgi:hypothetical protein